MDEKVEEWRRVNGCDGVYEVSSLGRVKSYYGGKARILKTSCSRGYRRINVRVDGKTKCFSVHRLVAIAFIPNPDNKPEVNHKDGSKDNNAVENLEWVTTEENIRHADTVLKVRAKETLLGLVTEDYHDLRHEIQEIADGLGILGSSIGLDELTSQDARDRANDMRRALA